MASSNFLPNADSELYAWARTFRDQIVADVGAFGLSQAQADAYSDECDVFETLFLMVRTRGGNSTSNVTAKNEAKRALVQSSRALARQIRGNPAVTRDQRVELGLGVPKEPVRSIAAPALPPSLSVTSTKGRHVTLRLRNPSTPDRLGKPYGVHGAVVMIHVGDTFSERPTEWTLLKNVTRTLFTIAMPEFAPAGAPVWVSAYWVTRNGKQSPPSEPLRLRVGEGIATAAKAA